MEEDKNIHSNTTLPPENQIKNLQINKNNDLLLYGTPTIYFKDKLRSVDYVIVWDAFEEEAITEKAYQRRAIFEANLLKEGLELEYEPQEKSGLNFIKVIACI